MRCTHAVPPAPRAAVYIDGFNLYYSLRAKEWRHCYWLDIHRFSSALTQPDERLVRVRYFTSRIAVRGGRPEDIERQKRQNTYLDALDTLGGIDIHYGRHAVTPQECRYCEAVWDVAEEKMTDVNIAVELLGDAQDDLFDTAIVVSGDTDLLGALEALRKRYPEKEVFVVFPGRTSNALRNAASGVRSLSEKVLLASQLPDQVVSASGYTLIRPDEWA